jgi:hypothetical protein
VKSVRLFLALLFLVASAHRAPAPIQEISESPTPAPTVAASTEPKIKSERTRPASKQTPLKTAPYAGTWAGTIGITLFGNIGYTFLIDSSQTKVTMWGTNKPSELPNAKSDICPASTSADGISWSWNMWTWTLKPYPNGKTALVKVTGPFQNASAVFEREK